MMKPEHTEIEHILNGLRDSTRPDVMQLKTVLPFLYRCFRHNDLALLDTLLFECASIKMSTLVSVALIRHTQEYKTVLTNWVNCANNVNSQLNAKSLDLSNFDISYSLS